MGQSGSSLALLSHTRFHCSVTFDPQQEKTTAISSSLDAQEFNSLCPIAPVMSISPPPPNPHASCSEMDHGGCNRDGSCSQGGEGGGRRGRRLNMFHIKLLFTSASKCNYHYIIYMGPIYAPPLSYINAMLGPMLRNKASFLFLLLIEI